MFKKMVTVLAACLVVSFTFLVNPTIASAGVDDCTGTPTDPVYPDYDSDEVLDTFINNKNQEVGTVHVTIRHGWYCVPVWATSPGAEYSKGVGFGLDKVQWRHNIGAQPGWTQEEAIYALRAVGDSSDVREKSDDWGPGYTIHSFTDSEAGCSMEWEQNVGDCVGDRAFMNVVMAVTMGGAEFDPQGGMKAGFPVGLQTTYCDQYQQGQETPELRCPGWVTSDLIEFAYEKGLAP